jgi:hypothetical protein
MPITKGVRCGGACDLFGGVRPPLTDHHPDAARHHR